MTFTLRILKHSKLYIRLEIRVKILGISIVKMLFKSGSDNPCVGTFRVRCVYLAERSITCVMGTWSLGLASQTRQGT